MAYIEVSQINCPDSTTAYPPTVSSVKKAILVEVTAQAGLNAGFSIKTDLSSEFSEITEITVLAATSSGGAQYNNNNLMAFINTAESQPLQIVCVAGTDNMEANSKFYLLVTGNTA